MAVQQTAGRETLFPMLSIRLAETISSPIRRMWRTRRIKPRERLSRAFVNTHLLVHKHVKISVDEWILENTCPQKRQIFGKSSTWNCS